MRPTEDYQKEYLKLFPGKKTIWTMEVPGSKGPPFKVWDVEFSDWVVAKVKEERDQCN